MPWITVDIPNPFYELSFNPLTVKEKEDGIGLISLLKNL